VGETAIVCVIVDPSDFLPFIEVVVAIVIGVFVYALELVSTVIKI
jgi:hypothetical protein